MIMKKNHIVDVKGWYHIQRNCILIWKHNLNKSHISLNLKLKTLNNPNGKCSQPNDYTNKTTNGIQKIIYNKYVSNLKVNQLKIIMNGNISLRV
jgi:hypothetical protein